MIFPSKYADAKNHDNSASHNKPEVVDLSAITVTQHRLIRIASPRLVNPAQITDFELEVGYATANDELSPSIGICGRPPGRDF